MNGPRRVYIDSVDGDRALASAIAAAVHARGGTTSPRLDATVQLVLRTPGADALRSVLGEDTHTFNARVIVVDRIEAVASLDFMLDARDAPPNANASANAPWATLLAELAPAADEAALGGLLLDPRCTATHERRALVERLAARATRAALDQLCASLAAHRGALGSEEATALGRAFASGASRWGVESPFAIELDDPREELSSAELVLFKNAGIYQRLADERGTTVHRAVSEDVPWIVDEQATTSAALLLRAIEAHAGARVWIRGFVLPAAMPWAIWSAVLGQRASR